MGSAAGLAGGESGNLVDGGTIELEMVEPGTHKER
jgi:hypothetical protein